MKAMVLKQIGKMDPSHPPLELTELPEPQPASFQILIRVSACGVCHTELDEIEGRAMPAFLPIIPGHQVVGRVVTLGENAHRFPLGDRVGVAWIFSACGNCSACRSGHENLCASFRGTGRDAYGGYAEYMLVHEDFAYPLPETLTDAQITPLLCAGAVGYRSLRLSGLLPGQSLGLVGFGASAHLVLKLVRHQFPSSPIFVFSRSETERVFARELGATWTGTFDDHPPQMLDAIIDTTPAWKPIVTALGHLAAGGRLVINAIRKESIDQEALLELNYGNHLWMEKEIKSVANVTRQDVTDFLALAAEIPLIPEYQEYPLEDANQALFELKNRQIRGAKVLRIK